MYICQSLIKEIVLLSMNKKEKYEEKYLRDFNMASYMSFLMDI